jgi:hypothetical protein
VADLRACSISSRDIAQDVTKRWISGRDAVMEPVMIFLTFPEEDAALPGN